MNRINRGHIKSAALVALTCSSMASASSAADLEAKSGNTSSTTFPIRNPMDSHVMGSDRTNFEARRPTGAMDSRMKRNTGAGVKYGSSTVRQDFGPSRQGNSGIIVPPSIIPIDLPTKPDQKIKKGVDEMPFG